MLGYEPIVEKMILVSGQDFSHYFGVDENDPFPAGTGLTLKVFERDDGDQLGAWPAISVTASGALVQIVKDDLDPLPDGAVFRVYVEYPDGQNLCWYRGRVWRRT
jgi:hypothetical protein